MSNLTVNSRVPSRISSNPLSRGSATAPTENQIYYGMVGCSFSVAASIISYNILAVPYAARMAGSHT